MKITLSAPIELSRCNDEEVLTDLEALKALHGTHCLRGKGEVSNPEYMEPGLFEGISFQDDGISLAFDEASGQVHYKTSIMSDKALTSGQIDSIKAFVVNMWQEGPGMEMSQIVLSDGFGLYISSGDDQVGDVGLSCVVTKE